MASLPVQLSHKFRKLFSIDAVQSLGEHMARWTHPVSASRVLATIDHQELKRLRERYPHRPDSPRINRFEDAQHWVGVNLERAQDLWLDRAAPLRILDLGCGSGFFLYICQLFGHEVVGVDRDTNPLFKATTDMLKVRRVIAEIDPNVPLPDLGQKFDLITAYRICFQRMERIGNSEWKEWSPREWDFFLNDIRSRFLAPRGRLLLAFNPRSDGTYFDPDVGAFFESHGARFFRSKALFAANPGERARFKEIRRPE